MKTKRILKILLIAFSILLIGLLVATMVFIIVIENASLKYRMFIPFFMIASGVLGIAYQFKTLKYYKSEATQSDIQNILFWISNAVFAITLVAITSYLAYTLTNAPFETNSFDFMIAILVCAIPFILGVCLLIEEALLYKWLVKGELEKRIDGIDDIKGNSKEDVL